MGREVVSVKKGVQRKNKFELAQTDHGLTSCPCMEQHLPRQRRYNQYCVTVTRNSPRADDEMRRDQVGEAWW